MTTLLTEEINVNGMDEIFAEHIRYAIGESPLPRIRGIHRKKITRQHFREPLVRFATLAGSSADELLQRIAAGDESARRLLIASAIDGYRIEMSQPTNFIQSKEFTNV